jgi:dTDP-4-dehydrorhamnose reductase
MKILVTGAYGQLGSELKQCRVNYSEWEFVFTDIDSLDLTQDDVVINYLSKNKFDVVINCAAYTAVDKAESEPDLAEKVNALAPRNLAIATKQTGAKLIHISTDYVFDGKAHRPYAENDEVNPQGVYGRTKLKGEQLCLSHNTDSIIIRTSWLYSSFGNNFVKTMLRLGKEKDALKVIFDQIGSPTYAADLAGAVLQMTKMLQNNPEKYVPGIYHYSNEGVASWYDFSKAIFELKGMDCRVQPVLSEEFPTPAKRPFYSVLDKNRIKNAFDLNIPYWKDSLKDCLKKI